MVLPISSSSLMPHTYDPVFTSAADTEDPTVIVNLVISNTFGTLSVRLFLDVLAGEASRDYPCESADAEFETTVHELKSYFDFLRLQRTCETILCFYSYDGNTNYVKYTEQGDFKEIVQSL